MAAGVALGSMLGFSSCNRATSVLKRGSNCLTALSSPLSRFATKPQATTTDSQSDKMVLPRLTQRTVSARRGPSTATTIADTSGTAIRHTTKIDGICSHMMHLLAEAYSAAHC